MMEEGRSCGARPEGAFYGQPLCSDLPLVVQPSLMNTTFFCLTLFFKAEIV